MATKKDFISILDFSREEIEKTFSTAADLKAKTKAGNCPHLLAGKTLACIFHKPSLRTRISFQVGMIQLGGDSLYITDKEIQIGRRESVYDVAKVLSRMVDGIMIRTFSHDDVVQLGRHAEVPVINGLTDLVHPCQVMGDLFTVMEKKGRVENVSVAFLGDGNNVANSWLNISTRFSLDLRIGAARGCEPNKKILDGARKAGLSEILLTDDPVAAVNGAEVVYTDVWASMGQEDDAGNKAELLRRFQVNEELLKHAAADCLVMHCLPAHRGQEITDEVMDGPHSVVFDQAENRLHIQKAIMVELMA